MCVQVVFGRVLGSLAVSRALGDMDFKYPYNKAEGHFVSGDPYIQKFELSPKNPFLVIACDGLWDKVTYEGMLLSFFLPPFLYPKWGLRKRSLYIQKFELTSKNPFLGFRL